MDAETFSKLSHADAVNYLNRQNAETTGQPFVPVKEPARFALLPWIGGALFVAVMFILLTVGAGGGEKDCKRVPGGQGQTLNVCVDEQGNISDGDR